MAEFFWLRAHVVLPFLFLVAQVSSASLFASTSTAANWNPPIRIGVQGSLSSSARGVTKSRKPRRFGSLLVASSQTSHLADTQYEPSISQPTAADAAADAGDDANDSASLYTDEWNALFPPEQDFQNAARTTATSSITKPRNMFFEETRGFRNTLKLPAILTCKSDEGLPYTDYEVAKVIPCAAVAVSSKINAKLTSFSLPPLVNKARESTISHQKDASIYNNNHQSTSFSARMRTTAAPAAKANMGRPLVFWENMVCGAISRSVAQTIMHPANTMKTILQQPNSPPAASFFHPSKMHVLFRGAGANFVLSVPHGAVNFAVLEMVRKELSHCVRRSNYLAQREDKIGAALDFLSSAISTVCCSVISTPQMMITDNIMVGNYKNLPDAVQGLASQGKGLEGFYARGWWPGLVGKIPSYALTWAFFQQLKVAQQKFWGRDATNFENTVMGCFAGGATVSIMIPLDTIKTRLVTQASSALESGTVPYKGIVDCAVRVAREEGMSAFYRGLPPRLISVVPMIGIQFAVYEFMKRVMQKDELAKPAEPKGSQQQQQQLPTSGPLRMEGKKGTGKTPAFDPYSSVQILQEASMEVAASPEHPYPAPHFLKILRKKNKDTNHVIKQ